MESIATFITKKWFLAVSFFAVFGMLLMAQAVMAKDMPSPKVAIVDISNTLVSKEKDFEKLSPEQKKAFTGVGEITHDGKRKLVHINEGLIDKLKEMAKDGTEIYINSTGKTSPDSISDMLHDMGIDIPDDHIYVANHKRSFASQVWEWVKSKFGKGVYNKTHSSYDEFEALKDLKPSDIAFYDDNKRQRKWAEEAGWQVHEPWEHLSENDQGDATSDDSHYEPVGPAHSAGNHYEEPRKPGDDGKFHHYEYDDPDGPTHHHYATIDPDHTDDNHYEPVGPAHSAGNHYEEPRKPGDDGKFHHYEYDDPDGPTHHHYATIDPDHIDDDHYEPVGSAHSNDSIYEIPGKPSDHTASRGDDGIYHHYEYDGSTAHHHYATIDPDDSDDGGYEPIEPHTDEHVDDGGYEPIEPHHDVNLPLHDDD